MGHGRNSLLMWFARNDMYILNRKGNADGHLWFNVIIASKDVSLLYISFKSLTADSCY